MAFLTKAYFASTVHFKLTGVQTSKATNLSKASISLCLQDVIKDIVVAAAGKQKLVTSSCSINEFVLLLMKLKSSEKSDVGGWM